MMKKIITSILLTLGCCFMLTACEDEPKRVTPVENDTSRFQYIGQDPVNANGNNETVGEIVQYYVDNKTNIVYIVMMNRWGNATWAGFTQLIDSDGTYVTYEEFKKAED
jgi:hypothetical protein